MKHYAMFIALTCLFHVAAAAAAMAEVKLMALDGSIAVNGDLVGYDGETYVLRTRIGEISVSAAITTCEGRECPASGKTGRDIRIGGSELLIGALLPDSVAEFAFQDDAQLVVTVGMRAGTVFEIMDDSGGTVTRINARPMAPADAFETMLRGNADMVLSSRRVTEAEANAFRIAGLGNLRSPEHEAIIAQDALVVVVAPDHPTRMLTLDQIAAIFSGRITNWSKVGGPDLPITVYGPQDGSGEAAIFADVVLGDTDTALSEDIQRLPDMAAIADAVQRDPGAIGLTSSALVRNARPLMIGTECGIVTPATDFTIKSEEYPLSRRLYLYASGGALPLRGEDMFALMQDKTGQDAVDTTGFVSLNASVSNIDSHGRRLAYALANPDQAGELSNLRRYAAEIRGAERLSTTFRFNQGSSDLDNRALADAGRMIDLLNAPQFRDRQVLLIGFTDSIGDSAANTSLSRRRAEQVLDTIASLDTGRIDRRRFQTLGFGPAAPVACNTDEFGRQLNRRVEVWVR